MKNIRFSQVLAVICVSSEAIGMAMMFHSLGLGFIVFGFLGGLFSPFIVGNM